VATVNAEAVASTMKKSENVVAFLLTEAGSQVARRASLRLEAREMPVTAMRSTALPEPLIVTGYTMPIVKAKKVRMAAKNLFNVNAHS